MPVSNYVTHFFSQHYVNTFEFQLEKIPIWWCTEAEGQICQDRLNGHLSSQPPASYWNRDSGQRRRRVLH